MPIIDRSRKSLKTEVENFQRISKEISDKLRTTMPSSSSGYGLNENQNKTLIFEVIK